MFEGKRYSVGPQCLGIAVVTRNRVLRGSSVSTNGYI